MSLQSDAAKAHIEKLLTAAYPQQYPVFLFEKYTKWEKEYRFAPPRLWRFDYAVPAILCANYLSAFLRCNDHTPLPDR